MADPKEKLLKLVTTQQKVIDAQKAASADLEKKRQDQATGETVQSFPIPSQLPNK